MFLHAFGAFLQVFSVKQMNKITNNPKNNVLRSCTTKGTETCLTLDKEIWRRVWSSNYISIQMQCFPIGSKPFKDLELCF